MMNSYEKVNIRENAKAGKEAVYFSDVYLSSILALDFVKKWENDKSFIRFTYDDEAESFGFLMVELQKGDRKTYEPVATIFPVEAVRKLGLEKFNADDY